MAGARFVASLVGTATIVMVGLAGRAAFGRERPALIAAGLAAFYPFVWLTSERSSPSLSRCCWS